MTKKQKKSLISIVIAIVLYTAASFIKLPMLSFGDYCTFALFLAAYIISGADVLLDAFKNIFHGQVFDENFLMAVASLGAFATGDYPEGVAVMIFYKIGELFESYAVGKSRRSIAKLMDIKPDYANIERDGKLVEVSPEEIKIGECIVIKPAERIPLDGVVLSGTSAIDTSALTGESVPRDVSAGDDVISGCINLSGLLKVQVTKPFGESTVVKILDLVENASGKKAKAENFIAKFAKYYTPAVVCAAVLLAVVPPIVLDTEFSLWIKRALIFLVISCPCALVISVPLSFFGGIGGASKRGILIKGSNYFEVLANAETVVFDKTGTLTKGVFNVTAIHSDEIEENKLIELAAECESFSDHPIALSLREAYGKEIDKSKLTDVEELAGRGVRATIDGKDICVGNDKLMDDIGAVWHPCHKTGTTVHVAVDKKYMGHIVISDEVKLGAAEALKKLKDTGVKKTVMLTGDSQKVAESVGEQLSIDEVHAQLLPAGKVSEVEKLLEAKSGKGSLVYVGDGINDAPVLACADIGIAMGALGTDAAIEAADIVLMNDDLIGISTAIKIAKRTLRIVKQNVIFALSVKAVFLAMGAFGFANMGEAVFADVGVLVIAILNSMRALITDKINKE